ncbi:MAG: hypothetical protein GX667_00660 [Xanthomonadaceae bacterium]|nr:hypothetical protein [Xanthomonadaceae bacterium]
MTTKEQLEKLFEPAFISSIGIPKLRELILTLAMQGKLTEQLPSDTPVETLLAEIEEERKALIKAKKIRRQKALPEITEEEIPFEVSKTWIWIRIGNIGNLFNGDSINASVRNNKYTNIKGTPYIATKDVGYGLDPIDYNNGVAIPDSDLSKFKTVPKNTVLICSEGGSAGKKCGLTDRAVCFGNKLFALDEYGGISAKFLLYTYLTPYFQKMFSERLTGIIGGVSIGRFSTILIALPPIEEQQRIVEKLDQLMAYCDQLEQDLANKSDLHERLIHSTEHHLLNAESAQEKITTWQFMERHFESLYQTESAVERLRGTLLQLAVTGQLIKTNKNNWLNSKVGDIITFEYGKGVPKMERLNTGVPVYGANGALPYFAKKALVDNKCIIIGRKGSAGALKFIKGPAYPSDVTFYVLPFSEMSLTYCYNLLLSLNLPKMAKGIKPGINRNEVYQLDITYPSSLVEQKRIVEKLDQLMEFCDQLEEKIKERTQVSGELTDSLVATVA